MIAVTIFIGLVGLGLVILIHETGHYIAARLSGIEVEAFALGWGRSIKSKIYKGTEYRINIFPVGGYCKMKGEDEFRRAIEMKYPTFPKEPGSLFSVSAVRRFLTYAAGPLFNLLFAVVLFSIVWGIGFTYSTYGSKIVLASDFTQISGSDTPNPADKAGLQSGDIIVSINGSKTENLTDIQNALMTNAGKEIPLTYLRNGKEHNTMITPEIDPSTGAGIIGIYSWIEPEITAIPKNSAPETAAGFLVGDRIIAVNNHHVLHVIDFYAYVSGNSSQPLNVTVLRDQQELELHYIPAVDPDGNTEIQLQFPIILVNNKAGNPLQAIIQGFREMISTFSTAFKSIRTLFMGVNLRQSLAGPIKITYLVGEATASGFQAGFITGIRTLFQLLGYISVALGFANLLPIPALDGGQMILAFFEGVTRRQLSPGKYYILQIAGFSILFAILAFTIFNDISSFIW